MIHAHTVGSKTNERDFVGREFRDTKQQIRSRLQGILENPTIAQLFTQPETKIDIFSELNSGAVILVDTSVVVDYTRGKDIADVIIATLGIHLDVEVWARDHHYLDIQKVLPVLKLFKEPP